MVTASIKADALALANQLLHFRAEVGVGQAALVLGVRLQLEEITWVIQLEIGQLFKQQQQIGGEKFDIRSNG